MIVNLVTIAVVTGFQQEVRQKVSGFGAHIFVMSSGEYSSYESEAIRSDQPNVLSLESLENVASVNAVGYKPVLLQSAKNEFTYQLANGDDTTEIQQQVQGSILKGIDEDYDWTFFEQHLLEGYLPTFYSDSNLNLIVISKRIASDLQYSLNDTISAFFVKNAPIKRKFIIAGIYETGLDKLDKKIILGNLSEVQELNDWGIKASIELADTLANGQLIIKADVVGGNGNFRYDWGDGFETYAGFTMCPIKDTVIRLIVSDFWTDIMAPVEDTSIPDTAYLEITIEGTPYSPCDIQLDDFDEIDRTYTDELGYSYYLQAAQKKIHFKSIPGKGSSQNYVGGFEIMINSWVELDQTIDAISKRVDFIPTKYNEILKTTSIKDNEQDIFMWLDFLDINVIIILSLMVLIGIINMGSALLVLILIRSNFIGMMKAMGATNWSIRKIFLIQATFLIGRGLIWGNIIGVGICLAQSYFGILTLNPEVYYLSEVPISLNVWHWLLLNIGTLLVCVLSLIIPSVVITRINPVKAIKFN
ncbi:MAG: FtsX-like permease family protein [Crocinitomicaceae bacterium]|nr:FtsX-like permease family protein [Crocinitomicaceae bacterium]